MLQRWQALTFLHWRYEPESIRALLPPQVILDTFGGAAWVALTPFLLTGLRPTVFWAVPWLSNFSETNVRTYVRGPDGQRGVWFFTLEADRLAAVLGARALYHLPYRWADMSVRRNGERVEYTSKRKSPFGAAQSKIAVQAGAPLLAGDFDNFLTARYRLYTVHRERLFFAAIEHDPWRLQSARLLRLEQDLIVRSGVPKEVGEPVVHFSADLGVRIGRLQRFVL
jgi:uncharacterized protein YqjF (DUF2071 family)